MTGKKYKHVSGGIMIESYEDYIEKLEKVAEEMNDAINYAISHIDPDLSYSEPTVDTLVRLRDVLIQHNHLVEFYQK